MKRNLFLILIIFSFSCTKLPEPLLGYGNKVEVFTNAASNISSTTANCGGSIYNDGGSYISSKGLCWNTSSKPTTINSNIISGTDVGSFNAVLSNLSPGTLYYVRAFAINQNGTFYGDEITFTTLASIPVISTNQATSISQTSAISGGIITSNGGSVILQKGVCWGTTSFPTISNSRTLDGSGSTSFNSSITGLVFNTTYYVRAYATNSLGTAYGPQISFTTLGGPPTLTTTAVSSILQTTAVSGGVISSNGGSTITQAGVCWSTSASPTTLNSFTNNGSGLTSYSSTLSNLVPGTIYHVRSYAINQYGTSYGNDVSFTTLALSAPSLVSPLSGTSLLHANSYNFSWGAVSGAVSYEFNVSMSSTFTGTSNLLSSCTLGISPSITLVNYSILTSPTVCMTIGSLTNNGTWYWRVRALNGAYIGPWSATNSFVFTF